MNSDRPIAMAGAGSIGCFVGGMYAAAGRRVALLARPRVIGEIEDNGLRLTGFEGFERQIAAERLTLSDDPGIFGDAGAVLVTVKSADTAEIADVIASTRPRTPSSSSLQNGVGNVSVLRAAIAGPARARGHGAVQCDRAGRGPISSRHLGRHRDRAGRRRHGGPAFGAGLEDARRGHIAGVQWGKLLFNLNNALNALSGLPLRQQLAQRPGAGCSPTRWRKGWPRSGPRASARCRRRRSRRA